MRDGTDAPMTADAYRAPAASVEQGGRAHRDRALPYRFLVAALAWLLVPLLLLLAVASRVPPLVAAAGAALLFLASVVWVVRKPDRSAAARRWLLVSGVVLGLVLCLLAGTIAAGVAVLVVPHEVSVRLPVAGG